jgi:hypothetical protein
MLLQEVSRADGLPWARDLLSLLWHLLQKTNLCKNFLS